MEQTNIVSGKVIGKRENQSNDKQISFNVKSLMIFISICIALLLAAHLFCFLVENGPARLKYFSNRFFNMNNEGNFPTLFSTFLLLLSSALLFFIYRTESIINKSRRKYWLVLAVTFLFLAFDESVQIHEIFVHLFKKNDLEGFLRFGWVVPYFILVVVLGGFFLNFVLGLPILIRNRVISSGFIYVFGALGIEFLEGYFFTKYGEHHFIVKLLPTTQELLEMIGIALFIHTLFSYITPNGRIELSINRENISSKDY